MQRYQEIERSIIKRFRKEIYRRFIKACKEYKLIEENDRIMVCISGGKDSFLLAKCMEELQRHSLIPFQLEFVVMDPGYSEDNRNLIMENAKTLNLELKVFESDIFSVLDKVARDNPCYLCARMRRGYLYSKAQELSCNKIALGHHFDDVIETTLLSMFYGCQIKTMMPKLYSEHFQGMELIRPLYMVKEEDIIAWSKYNDLSFLNCACKFTEECLRDENDSKRREIKQLIKSLRKNNPNIDNHIFKSLYNVNLDCVLGYSKGENKVSFLDDYKK